MVDLVQEGNTGYWHTEIVLCREAVPLRHTFTGHWLVQNSASNRMPSRGAFLFDSSYAINFVPAYERGRTAPVSTRTWLGTEDPSCFPGFGASILALCAKMAIAADVSLPDHEAHRGLASISYAPTQRQRLAQWWQALAGNQVMSQTVAPVFALCHLQQGSPQVAVGDHVALEDLMAACGNSTYLPVLVQAFGGLPLELAHACPLDFNSRF